VRTSSRRSHPVTGLSAFSYTCARVIESARSSASIRNSVYVVEVNRSRSRVSACSNRPQPRLQREHSEREHLLLRVRVGH
jgi:hypothetical protein